MLFGKIAGLLAPLCAVRSSQPEAQTPFSDFKGHAASAIVIGLPALLGILECICRQALLLLLLGHIFLCGRGKVFILRAIQHHLGRERDGLRLDLLHALDGQLLLLNVIDLFAYDSKGLFLLLCFLFSCLENFLLLFYLLIQLCKLLGALLSFVF